MHIVKQFNFLTIQQFTGHLKLLRLFKVQKNWKTILNQFKIGQIRET